MHVSLSTSESISNVQMACINIVNQNSDVLIYTYSLLHFLFLFEQVEVIGYSGLFSVRSLLILRSCVRLVQKVLNVLSLYM